MLAVFREWTQETPQQDVNGLRDQKLRTIKNHLMECLPLENYATLM